MSRREKLPGVFIHTHVKTGAFYIGTSMDVLRGSVEDKRRLLKGEHFNPRLQKLYDEDSELVTTTVICASPQATKVKRAELSAPHFSNPLLLNRARDLNMCAVYRLTHKPSGHFYIGSTADFTNRRSHHEYALTKGEHSVKLLQDLFNDNPNHDDIRWDVQLVSNRELAYVAEQHMLDSSKGDPLLLNLSSSVYGRGGYVMSSQEKADLSIRFKQQWEDPAYRARYTETRTKPVSIEGTCYKSYKHAAIALDVKPSTLHARIMSKSKTWAGWFNL